MDHIIMVQQKKRKGNSFVIFRKETALLHVYQVLLPHLACLLNVEP